MVRDLMTQLLLLLKHGDHRYRSEVQVTSVLESTISMAIPTAISTMVPVNYGASQRLAALLLASLYPSLDPHDETTATSPSLISSILCDIFLASALGFSAQQSPHARDEGKVLPSALLAAT
jgi:hypothetical protein